MRARLKHQRLAELIAASKITQNHWAIRLGLSRGHWSDIVNGKHPHPSAKTRQLILDAFGVTFDDLFVEDPDSAWADIDFRRGIGDRYIIDAEVGQGGMGAVYLARDIRHGRVVAIKVVAPEAVSGIGLDQFRREISTVAKLLHPNILPLYESGEVGAQPYFVMPYVRTGSLRARLAQETRLSVHDTMRMVRGIADALQHAHAERVLHCDVKPENVLLYGAHVWVTDFGIARRLRSEAGQWPRRDSLDISAGTPAYVSPEQAAGDPDIDARSDVYSLGCVAYEMLTGRSPFAGGNTQQVIARRFTAPPAPLKDLAPEVPDEVASVISRAMSLPRERRYHTAAAFADAFEYAVAQPATHTARVTRSVWRLASAVQARLGRTTRHPIGGIVRGLIEDLRLAVRVSMRNRTVTAAVLGTMIIGIAATTSMFSAVNGVLLRPLPFPESDRVLKLSIILRNGIESPSMALPDVEDFRRDTRLFSDFATATLGASTLLHGDQPQQILTTYADSQYARVFSVRPELGRFFSREHFIPDGERAVLISHGLWQREFGGDSSIVGQTITIGNQPTIVLGVLPPSNYTYPYPDVDLLAPLVLRPGSYPANRGALWLRTVAKLRPGVSAEAGSKEILNMAQRIEQQFPDAYRGLTFKVTPLRDAEVSSARSMLWLLTGTVVAVLLVACVNIANVLLAQSHARAREFAVRAALGGSAGRIRRQILTETVLLSVVGGAVGVLLAPQMTRALVALYPGTLPRAAEITADWRVLLAAAFAMFVAGLAAGFPSARRAVRTDLTRDLRSGTRSGTSARHRRVGNTLIVAQTAISLALVFAAGLLVRSFHALATTDVGFHSEHVLSFYVGFPRSRYPDSAGAVRFSEHLLQSMRDIPGVEGVAGSGQMPFTGNAYRDVFVRKEIGEQGPNNPFARFETVTRDFWSLQGIPVLAGRTFNRDDVAGSQRVVVLNQAAAKKFYGDENPVGRRIQYNLQEWEVIGVVGSIRMEDPAMDAPPAVYLSAEQREQWPGFVLLKSSQPLAALIPTVRAAVKAIDATIPVVDITTMDERVSRAMAPQRFRASVTTALGVLALVLSAIGIYGVISHAVGRETRDIGVRLALGEEQRRVRWRVLMRALTVVGLGVTIGGAVSMASAKWLSAFTIGTPARDPVSLLFAAAVLLGVAALAAYIPARRASRVDPMIALRSE